MASWGSMRVFLAAAAARDESVFSDEARLVSRLVERAFGELIVYVPVDVVD